MAMSKELIRLATYTSWPNGSLVSPLLLAKHGFHYVGNGDEVECFQCKIRLNGWSAGDTPETKHRQKAPYCQLLNKSCNGNVPLTVDFSHPNKFAITAAKGKTVTDGAAGIFENKLQTDEAINGLYTIYHQALSRAQKIGLFLNKSGSTIDRTQPDFGVLGSEEQRLGTFHDWPAGANANPLDLARAGFFYTGTGDRVQCFCCKGRISKWEPNDVPRTEHERLYPDCRFVRGLEAPNDHMINEDGIGLARSVHTTVQQQSTTASTHTTSEQTIIVAERANPDLLTQVVSDPPKFPDYSSYDARVKSFQKGTVGQGQTPEGLADAGWFYVGPNDKVRCFQCGGNLRDWEPDDDPWVEHKRWYDYCQFTKIHRPAPRSRPLETSVLMIPTAIGSYRIEPREVKARMDTPTVRAILDMGYSRDKVKSVIETRLSTTGDDFINAESLLDALFQLDESMSATSAGVAAASGGAPGAVDNAAHNNYSTTSASTPSRTSGLSAASSSASSSASVVSQQPDFASLPVTTSAKDSARAMASISTDSKMVSLKAEAAASATNQETNLSKSKAKKKKNKKKQKQISAASSSAVIGEDDAATEEMSEVQTDQEKATVDGDLYFEDIPDEEAVKYLEENRQLREQRTCKVCMDAEVNTVFLPCGHLVCCAACSPQLRACPICRTFIRGTVKTFLS